MCVHVPTHFATNGPLNKSYYFTDHLEREKNACIRHPGHPHLKPKLILLWS